MDLIQYVQEYSADAVIEDIRSDRDPVMSYGAQYTIFLEYCGTRSNKAVRILLHTSVYDVINDVHKFSDIGLVFVLYKTYDQVLQLVKLLMDSFKPHIRYASCVTVGISMAGTGDS